MKILQLVTAVGDAGRTGGVAEVALTQTEILREMGHDVTLLAGWIGAGAPPRALRGMPADLLPVRYATGRRSDLRFIVSPGMQQYLKRCGRDFDVAHVHLCRDLVTTCGIRTLHRTGVPIVTQTHGMLTAAKNFAFRAFDRALVGPALGHAAASLVLWPGETDQLQRVLGRPATTRPIQNAVDVGDRSWVPSESPVILFAARLHPRKQPQLFVRLAARVHEEFPAARFVIAGPDQGECAPVRELIDSLGLGDVVDVVGGVPRELLLDRMTSAMVYVLPSLDEPFPVTAMEAMAIGLPTVLTEQSGISEIARRRRAAIVVKPELDATADAVLELLRQPERQQEFGRNGRQLVTTVFSRASLGASLLACYESVGRPDLRLRTNGTVDQ